MQREQAVKRGNLRVGDIVGDIQLTARAMVQVLGREVVEAVMVEVVRRCVCSGRRQILIGQYVDDMQPAQWAFKAELLTPWRLLSRMMPPASVALVDIAVLAIRTSVVCEPSTCPGRRRVLRMAPGQPPGQPFFMLTMLTKDDITDARHDMYDGDVGGDAEWGSSCDEQDSSEKLVVADAGGDGDSSKHGGVETQVPPSLVQSRARARLKAAANAAVWSVRTRAAAAKVRLTAEAAAVSTVATRALVAKLPFLQIACDADLTKLQTGIDNIHLIGYPVGATRLTSGNLCVATGQLNTRKPGYLCADAFIHSGSSGKWCTGWEVCCTLTPFYHGACVFSLQVDRR
jgi:hypothetical protein